VVRHEEDRPILVVEDEAIVGEVVARYLRREGFRVIVAADGASALARAAIEEPRLVVLDLLLPDMDGLDVCRRLRAQGPAPILILTAKGDEADEVLGLGLGADDYVSKPLRPPLLVARVKALLRRSALLGAAPGGAPYAYGGLAVDPHTRRATRDGQPLPLTATEFDLLLVLARRPGTVFSREELLAQVWDDAYFAHPSTVTVHMRRLREKIEPEPAHPRYIKTVRGAGYKLADER